MDGLEMTESLASGATLVLPDSAPPLGLVPIATVMLAVELVTVLLNWSCTVTRTAGVFATPATAFDGCTVKASLAAAAGDRMNLVYAEPASCDAHRVTGKPVP